jgi:protein-tyrosine-phosphatase
MKYENPVVNHFRVPESNVFLMTRFRETECHRKISETIEYVLTSYGLEFIRADNPNWAALTIWDRVRFCMEASRYGIAVFETIDEPEITPNVSFELGFMMASARPFLPLKERGLDTLHSDLGGFVYKDFDSGDIPSTVGAAVRQWLQEIGARKRDGESLVVFVSRGGTCRCAMAKALTRFLLKEHKEEAHIRVESRAIQAPHRDSATASARKAVKKLTRQDLLAEHRPRNAGVGFLQEADLILAMDNEVLKNVRNIYRKFQGTPEARKSVRAGNSRQIISCERVFRWKTRRHSRSLSGL